MLTVQMFAIAAYSLGASIVLSLFIGPDPMEAPCQKPPVRRRPDLKIIQGGRR